MKKIFFTFWIGLWLCQVMRGQEAPVTRPATIAEIQQLFELATFKPQRFRIVAEITVTEAAWTPAQIAAELDLQTAAMKSRDDASRSRHDADLTGIRSNAIAKAHSGRRTRQVQEWYSANKYRLDQNQEFAINTAYLKAHPGSYKDTYVNIGDDPAFSPYQSFIINRELHDVQLSKSPNSLFAKNNLWRVLGLDDKLASPLIMALMDYHSVPPHHKGDSADSSLIGIKMDAQKCQAIHDGTDANWRLAADEELLDGRAVTCFRLSGKIFDPDGAPEVVSGVTMLRSAIEAVYWMLPRPGKIICLQAATTNLTTHEAFASQRGSLDANDQPGTWETSVTRAGVVNTTKILIKEIDPNPNFLDAQVFSPGYTTNDIVSDVTQGKAAILQLPHPQAKVRPPLDAGKRVYILMVLALLSLAPVLIVAFRWKRR